MVFKLDPYKPTMSEVFNEWRRRYVEDPSQFQDIRTGEGDYGVDCEEYYKKLEKEITDANVAKVHKGVPL